MNDWQAAAKHARAMQQTSKLPGAFNDRFCDRSLDYEKLFRLNHGLMYLTHTGNQSSTVSENKSVRSIENVECHTKCINLFFSSIGESSAND